MKRLRHILEYLVFRLLLTTVGSLSEKAVNGLGQKVGILLYRFGGRRKKIIKTNLEIAFGNTKSHSEKKKIARDSLIFLSTAVLQCLWLRKDPEKRAHQLFDDSPEGLEVISNALAREKGVFILGAHYGNWEAMGIRHGLINLTSTHSIVRKLDNPFLEEETRSFRTLSGNSIFYKDEPLSKLVRIIKNNGCVGVMLDQNTAKGGIFVNFFGKQAATARSIASLSLATRAAIVPMFCLPQENGRYKIRYGPEIQYTPTGDKDKDIFNLTQLCVRCIEDEIRNHPAPWMWLHRRWKTRPVEDRGIKIYS